MPAGGAAADYQFNALRFNALRQQNEIAMLDREWDRGRERYMLSGRYGTRSVPSKGVAIGMGLVLLGFGTVWMVIALGIARVAMQIIGGGAIGGAFLVFPMFGVLFLLISIFMAVDTYRKAVAYEEAESAYRHRRALLLAQQQQQRGR